MIVSDKRINSRRLILIVLAALAIGEAGMLFYAARQSRKPAAQPNPQQSAAPTAAAVASIADQWLGKWFGPEGTFLELSKTGDHYNVMIRSLDSLNTYRGTAVANGIEFHRNGKTENIRAGNGQDTGMKWLLDKRNCLVIHSGEGFCRD